MNYDLLEYVTELLTAKGIPAWEEYPSLERPEIDSPRAVVGLREMDAATGVARLRVKVLSPRILGGWYCQSWSLRTARTLDAAGLVCRTEQMTYNSGCDCFCVAVEVVMAVLPTADGWEPGVRWQVRCDDVKQMGVVSFRATQDLQRRVVGTHWKSEPVGITSGTGGWKLELVQELLEELVAEPDPATEPFVLTVNEGGRGHRYTGCCWNETVWEYTQGRGRLIRRGFALGREEISNG